MRFQYSVAILPRTVLSNADLLALQDSADSPLAEGPGVEEKAIGLDRVGGVFARRHFSHAEEPSGVAPLSKTALDALRRAGALIDQASMLVHMSTTPDGISPATAHYVHAKAGLPHSCSAFDLSSSCSSFLSCLQVVEPWAHTTGHQALLVVAEQKSRHLDPLDRRLSSLFGDGAFAALSQHEFCLRDQRLIWADPIVRSDLVGNIVVRREGQKDVLCMEQPRLMYRETVSAMHGMLERLSSLAASLKKKIRRCYVHQANAHLIGDVKKRLPEDLAIRIPILISDVGNLVAASLPVHRLRCIILEQLFAGLCSFKKRSLLDDRRALFQFWQEDLSALQPFVSVTQAEGSLVLSTHLCGEEISVVDQSTDRLDRSWLAQISADEWNHFFDDCSALDDTKPLYGTPCPSSFGEGPSLFSDWVDVWMVAGGGFQCLGCLVPFSK